jgi:MauM/NapG family ferredoxin protein
MGAIREDLSTSPGECIVCLKCVYTCPQNKTRFTFRAEPRVSAGAGGITRRQFLLFALFSAASAGTAEAAGVKRRQSVIRPPAALAEKDFLQRCIRCGNCMKVCITNGLQPVMFQSGLSGIWTPQLVPEIGYCEYRCTLCGNVCPTGAIPRLTEAEKKKTRLGLALIDRKVCLPWKENKECLVCEEHCPVSKKAIRFREYREKGKLIKKPHVDPRLCIGCAICQTKCPTRPRRAIIVYPVKVDHGVV